MGRSIYSASGQYLWARTSGDVGSQVAYGVAIDSYSNIVVTGQFSGTVDFGGGPMTSDGSLSPDIFLVKLSSGGSHIWSKRLGGSSSDSGRSVAVDGSDNVLVTGWFVGAVDFGGGTLSSAGGLEVFAAKYSPAGAYKWAKRFGGSSSDVGNKIIADNLGDVFVGGYFQNAGDFGGGVFLSSTGGLDAFLLKLAQ